MVDAKNKQFLERLSGLAREGRRPLTEFLKISGQTGDDDLRTMRSFLFDLYCQIYSIDPATTEGSSVRFKFFQELAKGESIEEITNLFIGNLYLTEYRLKAATPQPTELPQGRGLGERARQLIEQGYTHRLSLNSLANDLAVSKEHLSRVFKKKFGITVTEHIHHVRIENARRMIATGEYSLKQVCYETGYQSYNDFYRNFRKVTGVSPKCFVEPDGTMTDGDGPDETEPVGDDD